MQNIGDKNVAEYSYFNPDREGIIPDEIGLVDAVMSQKYNNNPIIIPK